MKRSALLPLLLALAAVPARADSGKLHLHADFGVGGAIAGEGSHQGPSDSRSVGGLLGLGLDWQLRAPFALEALFQAGGFSKPFPTSDRTASSLVSFAVGGRFRFLDDDRGYTNERGGRPAGDLYLAAHVGWYAFDSTQYGFDFTLGYEFSIHRPVSIGPMARLLTLIGGRNDGPDVVFVVGVGTSFEVVDPPSTDDRDHDGIPDAEERRRGTDPGNADTDGDSLPDQLEIDTNTDPTVADTDGDGLSDGFEDANANGLLDLEETDPRDFDTDGGGISDGDEVITNHTDPRDRHDDDEDSDGVPNDADSCPSTPSGSRVDAAGCPERVVQAEMVDVPFVAGRTRLAPEGEAAMQTLVTSLANGRARIRVYVAGTGDAAADALTAQRRADALGTWLAQQNVARERFTIEPIGADPVADRTSDGNVAHLEITRE